MNLRFKFIVIKHRVFNKLNQQKMSWSHVFFCKFAKKNFFYKLFFQLSVTQVYIVLVTRQGQGNNVDLVRRGGESYYQKNKIISK